MSENPVQLLLQALSIVSESIQTNLYQFIHRPKQKSVLSIPAQSAAGGSHLLRPKNVLEKTSTPTAKEELGRATWIFLHTLAAQYPDKPTRQQKKDVKDLMSILSRMYPCKECADHFTEVLRANPVRAGSHEEFSQWLCHVHNVVNRSLGKVTFPCDRVDARWGKLECEQRACDLQGTSMSSINGAL